MKIRYQWTQTVFHFELELCDFNMNISEGYQTDFGIGGACTPTHAGASVGRGSVQNLATKFGYISKKNDYGRISSDDII